MARLLLQAPLAAFSRKESQHLEAAPVNPSGKKMKCVFVIVFVLKRQGGRPHK